METMRSPAQGLWNIIRFNRHFYILAVSAVALIVFSAYLFFPAHTAYACILCGLILLPVLVSLAISFYIYDLSGLYDLRWLGDAYRSKTLVNVHAGFDETSALLSAKYPESELHIFDFYDPLKHTEVSIKRARKAYPAHPGTQAISTAMLPLADGSADAVFLIFAAHEIRNAHERELFFRELKRILDPGGSIVLVEHLRDFPNFFAYTLGFFHFLAEQDWQNTFRHSGLKIRSRYRINPFVNTFILTHDGITV